MTPRNLVRFGGAALTTALLAGVAAPAMAGSFYVQEQSTRGQGRANAGVAADKGVQSLWWNPAAIAGTSREVYVGMHGLILVDSQPEQGARFTLYLPRIKEEEAMDPVAHQAIPTGREHVVYVDDEDFLVDVGSEILRGLGYQVTGFTDSDEALRFVQARAPEVNLVVSDMTMP